MNLLNQTKKTQVVDNLIEAHSLKQHSIGMLAYKTPQPLLIKTRFGIHTFFMNYPIDIIILDKNNRVIDLNINMQPNRIFFWNWKYTTVIELPAGTIKKSLTEIEDTLSFS